MQRHRLRRAGAAAAMVATIAGGLAVASSPAGSQSGSCTGSSFVLSQGVGVLNDRTATIFSFVLYDWVTSRTYDVPTIPAGTYALDARSYDGYTARATSPAQPFEMWKVEFLATDGRVLATSGTTGDIPDGVQEAWWVGSIGSVTLSEPVSRIRVVHAYLADDASPNSVNPVCIGGTLQVPPTVPPTTAPPPTIPPTTPPTIPPTTSTTVPPTTSTTSSIPVEVLPEVLPGVPGTPPALPQVREPSYTG